MIRHRISAVALFVAALGLTPLAAADSLPANWDNLVKIDSKKLEAVYVLPGADFRPFNKVMLDPTEVAFRKDWQQNYNNSATFGMRVTDQEVQNIIQRASTGFSQILAKAFTDAGYQVVTTPAEDVLRVKTAIINLSVTAPDTNSPNNVQSYARDAGRATVVFEARDSVSGAILGRAADARIAGDMSPLFIRNRATNTHDFEQVFQAWAQASVNGLAVLKSMSPVNVAAASGTPAESGR